MSNLQIGLICFQLIVLLALYWTLWKIRAELIEGRKKLDSELSEVKKILAKETGGN